MEGMSGGKGAVRKIDLDAFFQLAEEVASFHALLPGLGLVGPPHLSGIPRAQQRAKNLAPFHPLPEPAGHSGFVLVGREDLHGIPPAHASGRTKNRAPFHLALFQVSHDHGIQQARGRVHQRIARHGGLAKDRAPDLIRRDEPPTGALSSNAILRFEKATYTYHFHTPKMSRIRCVALL